MNILFDLDGTLTDPREGITARIKHALSTLGRPLPADAELTPFIGPPLRDSFRELLSPDDDVDAAVAAYRDRFAAVGMFENAVYAGHFSAVHGSELDGRRADKGELIARALSTSGLSPADTVMVGDRRHNMDGALANGVFPAGVPWGYGSREELTAAAR